MVSYVCRENNLQNDALTFDFAAGCDWWFHAKQAPGSHVIVKTNGEELPTVHLKKRANLPLIIQVCEAAKKSKSII